MRRDRAAVEARRQRAAARVAATQPEPAVKDPRPAVPCSVADTLAFAESLGWTWTRMKNGYRLTHPSGATAMLHLTPSDFRAWRNIRADLLRGARQPSDV